MPETLLLARALWFAWLLGLFLGFAAWAYAPGRKRELERHGRMPLRQD